MKRVLFVTSHFCSGSKVLFESLSDHPRIEGYRTHSVYESPHDLIKLTNLNHKLENSSAVYMDELLVNHSIACKRLYQDCNYVFVIRPPRETLNEIVATMGYSFNSALSYYTLRLKRMVHIAKHAKRQTLLTSRQIENGQGANQIENLLSLKDAVIIKKMKWEEIEDAIPLKTLLEAQKVYDQTIEFMKAYCSSEVTDTSCHSLN